MPIPLAQYHSNPWGLPPRVDIGFSPHLTPWGLPKLRVHVEKRHDFDPRAPRDPWGMSREELHDAMRADTPAAAGSLLPTTPSDVLAYRQTWDAFILGVVRSLQAGADAAQALADGKDPGTPTTLYSVPVSSVETDAQKKTRLTSIAAFHRTDADVLLSEWNMFANLSDADLVLRSGFILASYQKTVQHAGHFRGELAREFPKLSLPDAPGVSAQAEVIGRIEGAKILAHGVLELMGIGLGGGLDTLGAVGSDVHQLLQPGNLTLVLVAVAAAAVGIGFALKEA